MIEATGDRHVFSFLWFIFHYDIVSAEVILFLVITGWQGDRVVCNLGHTWGEIVLQSEKDQGPVLI